MVDLPSSWSTICCSDRASPSPWAAPARAPDEMYAPAMGEQQAAVLKEVSGVPKAWSKAIAMILAIGLAAIALLVIWLVAVPNGPEICALSMPGPRNCFDGDREHSATLASIAVVLVAALTIALQLVRPKLWPAIRAVAWATLALSPAWAYVVSAWIPALA